MISICIYILANMRRNEKKIKIKYRLPKAAALTPQYSFKTRSWLMLLHKRKIDSADFYCQFTMQNIYLLSESMHLPRLFFKTEDLRSAPDTLHLALDVLLNIHSKVHNRQSISTNMNSSIKTMLLVLSIDADYVPLLTRVVSI